jgi:hypothetical protein
MWVVIAKRGKHIHRDDVISDLLDLDKDKSIDCEGFFITKNSGNYRYNVVSSLYYAKVYKSKGYCDRIVKKFEFYKNGDFHRNPFHWLKEFHLSYREITKDEWDKMCENEQRKLEQSYHHHKNQIELKRKSFK